MENIKKEDFGKWFMERESFELNEKRASLVFSQIQDDLGFFLSGELKDFILLSDDQDIAPKRGCDSCLAKYDQGNRIVLIDVLFCSEGIVHYTKMLTKKREGGQYLLVIGADYDENGEAYILYDLDSASTTYRHVFHWRYHSDPLRVGDGLGFLAPSLKEFLLSPSSREEL
ncbi:SMI1/KNR4 family protein [Pectobacterium aroidearum]|uniref:SMI1/KNR4 family protein n=1 Tax=Pectobacterium aroidearum TaxID=1201031 RepID=A0ABR5ZB01_9GAMM|nr:MULTISPECIES: SMI1/KNR4 family protein [Pectobacterium]MBA5198903.1 SMI1/KNR4 family protein [Pectobacterium aroidearum]MBA5230114.1 SMI1/KNR4 family protein [Pectobacterium aroidearum]MBA5231695.1 SMI1/KNR4 family protein [Pectobacterium aroidearum]MBA5739261.1 SMI1/KNR4 family protein [Pectobacterium aroidearum]UXJ99839.1 SMI1/KNR4 family protein [Pectobacterium aroidearum]